MANSDKTKVCIACASDIPIGAKLCTHCGTYQNWRRYMNVSSTFLALLVALITVSTPLVQALADWTTEDPEITLTQPIVVDGKLSLLATNLGERAAAISEIRAELPGTNWAEPPSLEDNSQYIVPNGSRSILVEIPFLAYGNADWTRIYQEFRAGNEIIIGERMDEASNPNKLIFKIKRYDNTEYEVTIHLDFAELTPLVEAHRERCSELEVPRVFGSLEPPSTGELEISELETEANRLGCVSSAFYEARNVY